MSRATGFLIIALTALAALLGSTAPLSSAPGPGVPAIVQRAAEVQASGMHGVVGMQRHFLTTLAAGPLHRSEQSDSGQVWVDGVSLRVKFYRIVRDGKVLSPSELEQRDAENNKDWEAGRVFFKEPYDPRYLQDYTYAEASRCECAPGVVAVDFSSSLQDTQHGQGTMWIDTVSAHVQRLTYQPNRLPAHATQGTVTEYSSATDAGVWYVTKIEQRFEGHELFLRGKGTFDGTYDHFRRFSNADSAQVALQKDSL